MQTRTNAGQSNSTTGVSEDPIGAIIVLPKKDSIVKCHLHLLVVASGLNGLLG